MNAQSFKNLSAKIFDCFTVLKIHEKIENRQIFVCYCFILYKEKMLQKEPQLKVNGDKLISLGIHFN